IQNEAGCALLIIEHDMPLIRSISDEIIALDLGAVLTQGPPDDVLTDPRVVSSYLGGDLAVINRSGEAGDPGDPAPKPKPTRRVPLRARSTRV
ncbi:MAG: hypothetical protein QOJ67_2006, partial [Acidimicrobiaceae bacterium]